MTTHEARVVVQQLAQHFGVPIPFVEFSTENRSRYYPWKRTRMGGKKKYVITLAHHSWIKHRESSLIHEFAHHLTAVKQGIKHGHDQFFMHNLALVVHHFYQDMGKYPWDKEYPSVAKYAAERGFSK